MDLGMQDIFLFLMAVMGNGLLGGIFMRLGSLGKGVESNTASIAALWSAVNDLRDKKT